MLTNTFLHAQGVGDVIERHIWNAGILTWDDLLRAAPSDLPMGAHHAAVLRMTVEKSQAALAAGDYRFFARVLPPREHWRCAPQFMDGVGFLDIETNGGYAASAITVIGVYNGFDSRLYVRGRDLEAFEVDAKNYTLWVTFFGTGFDIPFLKRRFANLPFDQLHIDLCPALRRLGFKGGLKKIETTLGIARADGVDGLGGMDAVRLWRQWSRMGDEEALDLLLAYNRADIENLALLLAFAYGRLKSATGFPANLGKAHNSDSDADMLQ